MKQAEIAEIYHHIEAPTALVKKDGQCFEGTRKEAIKFLSENEE